MLLLQTRLLILRYEYEKSLYIIKFIYQTNNQYSNREPHLVELELLFVEGCTLPFVRESFTGLTIINFRCRWIFFRLILSTGCVFIVLYSKL